jgi:hypothetical protein
MNNIKFIEFTISNTLTGNRHIKLTNNLFIAKGGYCLKLFKLNKKKTQFKLLDNSPQMMWSILIVAFYVFVLLFYELFYSRFPSLISLVHFII